MRGHIAAVLLLVLCGGVVGGCASGGAEAEPVVVGEREAIESDRVAMVVRGMSCPKCADNIDLQLKSVRGVRDVAIDLGTGEVLVEFEAKVHPTRADLERAIEKSGFTLVSIEARGM